MDILAILKTAVEGFSMTSLWTLGLTAVLSIVLYKTFDQIFFFVIGKFWPEKYLELVYAWVSEFLDKPLDEFEVKFPASGKKLRSNILAMLAEIEKRLQ